jgi:hypothetical protein
MRKLLVVIIHVSLFITATHSFGQSCCAPGTSPLGALEQGSILEKQLQIGFFYEFYSAERAIEGTDEVFDPQDRRSKSQIASLSASAGIIPRVSASLVVPFQSRKRRQIATGMNEVVKFSLLGRGIGDIAVMGKWNLIPFDVRNQREVTMGLGVKFPTGSNEQERNGVRVPVDLQPGSGAWDGLSQVYLLQGFQKLNIVGSSLFRYTGSNDIGYRFGNELLYLAGLRYSLSDGVGILGQLKGRVVDSDTRYKGTPQEETVPSTGNHRLHLSPGIRYRPTSNLWFQASFQYPIYQWVKGNQLATDFSFFASTDYSFYY